MFPAFIRQLTPVTGQFMGFDFHMYLTIDSKSIADAKLPRSYDKCPGRRQSQKSRLRGHKR
jgi:hypothetical protein